MALLDAKRHRRPACVLAQKSNAALVNPSVPVWTSRRGFDPPAILRPAAASPVPPVLPSDPEIRHESLSRDLLPGHKHSTRQQAGISSLARQGRAPVLSASTRPLLASRDRTQVH